MRSTKKTRLEALDRIHDHANLDLRTYMTNRERVGRGLPILIERPGWRMPGYLSLVKANLSGADLRSVSISGANLGNANLWVANLKGANLEGANLMDAIRDHSDHVITGWAIKDGRLVSR